tara:strand:+ start:215 stop:700 length:486 start_codon:yes stop_codon:yes gene_type:complete
MSELRTNRIVPRDGLASGCYGGIIQVKQVTTDQQVENAFSSETTLLTLAITPTRSDSKILVCVNCCGVGTRGTGTSFSLRIKRDSTHIWAIGNYGGYATGSGAEAYPSAMYLDSPATTSAVTYTFTGTRTNGGDNCYFNHMNSSGVGSQAGSSMTLMEVSG